MSGIPSCTNCAGAGALAVQINELLLRPQHGDIYSRVRSKTIFTTCLYDTVRWHGFTSRTDDLYDLYDLYDMYDMHDMYDLHDMFPVHDLHLSAQMDS